MGFKFFYNDSEFSENVKKINQALYKILKELNSDLEHKYAGIFVTVKHEIFKSLRIKFLRKLCVPNSIIFDLKSIYSFKDVDLTL